MSDCRRSIAAGFRWTVLSSLAVRPISSLIAVKQTMVEPTRGEITAAAAREYAQFAELLGGVANADALASFANRQEST